MSEGWFKREEVLCLEGPILKGIAIMPGGTVVKHDNHILSAPPSFRLLRGLKLNRFPAPRMRSSRILAFDLGAGHVACGVFGLGATGRIVLQRFALEFIDSDPAHEARWNDQVAQALVAIAAREKIKGAAALAIPGHLALTKFIKAPALDRSKREQAIRFEASQNIPYPLAEVVWNNVVIADDGFDLEVMLAAVKLDAMDALCTGLDAAGFAVNRATPACLAMRAAFRLNTPGAAASVVLVNIGARSTSLLFLDGERFTNRTLALGGNQVTQAIADELAIDFAQAEGLKVSVLSGRSDLSDASPARAAVQRAAAGFIGRLHLEINRSTINHRRQSGTGQPATLYLTGGGSLIAELPAVLAERLKLPVERYQPLKTIDVSADARAAGAESVSALLADLVGLAVPLIDSEVADASLLPPALTATLAFRKQQPVLLAAAVLAVAALLPPVLYFNQRVAAVQSFISQADSQLMPLRSVEARNADHLARIEEAKKQIAAIDGLVATKANWINFLGDLQSRLAKVGDVWLEKISIVVPSSDSVPAAAPDAAAGTAPAVEAPPLRLTLSGRLLDVANPVSNVSPESNERVKKLLASFTGSAFVAAVENEHFDNTQPGLLRFDFTLVVSPKRPL